MDGTKGSIAGGKDADLLLFGEDIRPSFLMVRGEEIPVRRQPAGRLPGDPPDRPRRG
jgi:imidazolonepropionase-like amidohydrolase